MRFTNFALNSSDLIFGRFTREVTANLVSRIFKNTDEAFSGNPMDILAGQNENWTLEAPVPTYLPDSREDTRAYDDVFAEVYTMGKTHDRRPPINGGSVPNNSDRMVRRMKRVV